MKLLLFLCLLLVGSHTASCSRAVGENNAGSSNFDTAQFASPASKQSAETIANKSFPNPRDAVFFDGKNYIKKSGWKVPSRKEAYVDDTYDGRPQERATERGRDVETTTVHYIYKAPWFYSQDFYYEGRDLDYMIGKLKANDFLEMSAKGNVFMYSIFGEKVVLPPASNSERHEDPFGYQIQDRDGDGIFETLLGPYDDIIVPNWVLK
jgi:hypothetical protein